MEVTSLIRAIESEVYPSYMQSLQDCYTMEDLADYCEVSLKNLQVYTEANAYMLVGCHRKYIEVADMASNGHFNVFSALNFIKSTAKGRTIKFDAKEDTSYPLVSILAKHGKIKIKKDNVWQWGDIVMHEMEVVL